MTQSKSTHRRIAVATELNWPLRRHYELISGVQEYAEKYENWQIDVTPYPEVQMELGVRFDGIVGRIGLDTLSAAKKAGTPIVNVLKSSSIANKMPSVLIDPEAAGRIAAEHLINRGMPRLISVELRLAHGRQEHGLGVAAAARERGIPYRRCILPAEFEDSNDDWRQTFKAIKPIIEDWAPPIGLVSSNDATARTVITLLADQGWDVPKNLSVVGLGNETTTCTMAHPSTSSVDLGVQRNGYEAARLLAGLMRGEKAPTSPIVIPPKALIVRSSSDVFSVRDPEVQKALRFMADNSHHSISVPQITATTGIGRQTLERRFRAELDTTIYNELHRLRIERVKRLLVEQNDIPIKQIGLQSGFSSLSNFYAAFKRQTGQSPAAYRDEHADPQRW